MIAYFMAEPGARAALLFSGRLRRPTWQNLLVAGASDGSSWSRWAERELAAWQPLGALAPPLAARARLVARYLVDIACAAHAARFAPNSPEELLRLYEVAPWTGVAPAAPDELAPELAQALAPSLVFCGELLTEVPRAQPLPPWLSTALAALLAVDADAAAALGGSVLLACVAGRLHRPQLRRPTPRARSLAT